MFLLKSESLYCFALVFGLHCVSFVSEWMYQRFCYPVSFYGLFTSIVTTSSVTCEALRTVSHNMDHLFMNVMLAMAYRNITLLVNYIKQN